MTQVLDAEARIMYLWGEVLNHTGEDQHLSTVAARVYDQTGILIADAYNTISIIPVTALVEGRKIPFELTIVLPDREFQIEQLSYELYVEARPAWYETREDLTILDHSWTTPEGIDGVYEIRGTVRNQGPPLDSHLKVIATLYDAEGYVVGLDWFHKVESSYLAPGAFQFTIQVEDLPAEATSYELQALGR